MARLFDTGAVMALKTEGRTGCKGTMENVLSLGMQHEALPRAVQPIVLYNAYESEVNPELEKNEVRPEWERISCASVWVNLIGYFVLRRLRHHHIAEYRFQVSASCFYLLLRRDRASG